jgi:hypothetical protein
MRKIFRNVAFVIFDISHPADQPSVTLAGAAAPLFIDFYHKVHVKCQILHPAIACNHLL